MTFRNVGSGKQQLIKKELHFFVNSFRRLICAKRLQNLVAIVQPTDYEREENLRYSHDLRRLCLLGRLHCQLEKHGGAGFQSSTIKPAFALLFLLLRLLRCS